MWIGERITEKGVGNGISIVLVINIISRMPEDMGTLWSQFIANKSIPKGIVAAPDHHCNHRCNGSIRSSTYRMQSVESQFSIPRNCREENRWVVSHTHIPLKVNTGGVIPVIFASVTVTDTSDYRSVFLEKVMEQVSEARS